MERDYFTLEEAQALLPRVESLLNEASTLKRRADQKILAWKNGGPAEAVDMVIVRGQVEFLLVEARRCVEAVHALGAQVKDLDRGLVDFPGWLSGEGYVCFCWKLGETELGFWHRRTEGFSKRKPIPVSIFSNPKDK